MRRYKKWMVYLAVFCIGMQGASITGFAAEQGAETEVKTEAETKQTESEKETQQQSEGKKEDQPQTQESEEQKKQVPPPVIQIGRKKIKKNIKPGKEFELILTIDNSKQNYALQNAELSLKGTSEMVLKEASSNINVGTIGPGEVKEWKIKLKTESKVTSSAQSLGVRLDYDYETPEGAEHGAKESQIMVPTSQDGGKENGKSTGIGGGGDAFDAGGGGDGSSFGGEEEKKEIAIPTPNVIISKHEYGGQITAGEEFKLKLELKNTSTSTPVENMIMSLEMGEALAITDGSNSFYIDKIAPQGTLKVEIPLKALASGKPEDAKVDISFKYEYVSQKTRTQATATEKLGIPMVQPDRFIAGEPKADGDVHQGSEATLSIPYVNKGKGTIYNVEAKLESKMDSSETYKYLGNFEAGANGSIDFLVTPQEMGEQEAKITITYEDSSNKQQKVEKTIKLNVLEPSEDDFMAAASSIGGDSMEMGQPDMEETDGSPKGLIFAGIGLGVAVLAAGIVIYRRRKAKKEAELMEDLEDDL